MSGTCTNTCGDATCQSWESVSLCSADCELYFAWPQRGCNNNWNNVAKDSTNTTTTTPSIMWRFNITNENLGLGCYNAITINYLSPVIGDIDGDKMQEVVFLSSATSTEGNRIWAVNDNGSLMFTRQLTAVANNFNQIAIYPIVEDVNRDGKADIIYTTGGGTSQIINLNSSNQIQWSYNHQQTSDNDFSLILHLANVTSDNYYEIVSSDNSLLEVINGSGMNVWNYNGGMVMTGSGGDSNNDKLDELFIGSTSTNSVNLLELSSQGNQLWASNYQSSGYYKGAANLNTLSPSDMYVTFVDTSANTIQTVYASNGMGYNSLNAMGYLGISEGAVGNLTGGNWLDFVVNYDNDLYIYNSMDFSQIWNTNSLWTYGNALVGGGVIGDINGDGQLDVIGFKDNNLYAFRGNNGQELWNIQVAAANSMSITPRIALADINKDGKLDIIIATSQSSQSPDPCNDVGYNTFAEVVAVTTE
ncbi:Repeat domain in Vibrio, Colwellia, Bradyrhizobium and Shewanella [Candidatus Tiddalikarchaeum anstoanum]|nr:Repeat domain in Vibrio, Colwellia, Bradyrhizobium and Shewanella [Candidatus Tiddalikarchaeum anstoanum]